LGITSILVTGKRPSLTISRSSYAKNRSSKTLTIPALWSWLKLLWLRIDEDHMTTLAGNLAYVSLLSLVPLIAVVFAFLLLFRCFLMSASAASFIFANFIPATGDVIQGYIEQFVANSSKMTAVGACGLIVTSLLLMYSIDSALNTIWRSTRVRPKVYSFAVYWMILTLGPLLAGRAWR
jgi:membrane protein